MTSTTAQAVAPELATAEKSEKAVGSRDKSVAWYYPTLSHLPAETKQLLQTYSELREEEIIPHIYAVRDQAWEVWPFPCIGQFRFLQLELPHSKSFAAIVSHLQGDPDALFMDLGCCLGQDLRALAVAGIPNSQIVGADLHGEFHTLGKKLFRDGGEVREFGAQLIAADVFDLVGDNADSTPLTHLQGKIHVLQASAFFHLFPWDRQREAGICITKLMKEGPGALIVGIQAGSTAPGLYAQGKMYLHNVESFGKLWEEVGRETGSEWRNR